VRRAEIVIAARRPRSIDGLGSGLRAITRLQIRAALMTERHNPPLISNNR